MARRAVNADTAQTEHRIDYTAHGRIQLHAPDGTLRCEEEGTGDDCVRQWGLPSFGFAGAYRSQFTGLIYLARRSEDSTVRCCAGHTCASSTLVDDSPNRLLTPPRSRAA